ncbi:MAG: RsmE family RNA methyltransferase [Rickettsiales bacterium]
MKPSKPKIRLFIDSDIILNHQVEIANNDFEYLSKVMRQKINDEIEIFNGINGDFRARIIEFKKKSLILLVEDKIKNIYEVPNISLAFAPVKNVRLDFIASKATELGVKNFYPIITQRTIVDKINPLKFQANIKEALEQCLRNDRVNLHPICKLANFLKNDFSNKIIVLADESGRGAQAKFLNDFVINKKFNEIVLFVGPEGGFCMEEFNLFDNFNNCFRLNLGPRILRADTAIISSLTLIQEFLGDFNRSPHFNF